MSLLQIAKPVQKFQKKQKSKTLGPQELIDKHYNEAVPYYKLLQYSVRQKYIPSVQQTYKVRDQESLPLSGPQGYVKPLTVIQDPSFWYPQQFENSKEHIYKLSQQDLQELIQAVKIVETRKLNIQDVKKQDFILPTLGPKLEGFKEEVRSGRGFQLLKGMPVRRFSRQQILIAYWGMGLYWGNTASQNKKGHYIGHIKSLDADVRDPNTRVYMTNLAQPFHTDSCDLVGLLCLHPSKEGGNSSWTSSVTIHNEMIKLGRRDLVQTLASDFYLDRKGEIPDNKLPYYRMPVFSYYKGYFQAAYSATYYELAQRHEDVPRLTQIQEEALLWFSSLAQSKKLRMDYNLEEGDIQLLSNHTMLHNRTAYQEFEEPEKRRHLLRLWLAPENERELPEQYEDYFGNIQVGHRGGIVIPDIKYNRVPLDAE